MNLRKLKRELGNEVEVSRDRKLRVVKVSGNGLSYRMEERAFKNERELAAYAASKMPALKVKG